VRVPVILPVWDPGSTSGVSLECTLSDMPAEAELVLPEQVWWIKVLSRYYTFTCIQLCRLMPNSLFVCT